MMHLESMNIGLGKDLQKLKDIEKDRDFWKEKCAEANAKPAPTDEFWKNQLENKDKEVEKLLRAKKRQRSE